MGKAEAERAAPHALAAERSGVKDQWQLSLAPAPGAVGQGCRVSVASKAAPAAVVTPIPENPGGWAQWGSAHMALC